MVVIPNLGVFVLYLSVVWTILLLRHCYIFFFTNMSGVMCVAPKSTLYRDLPAQVYAILYSPQGLLQQLRRWRVWRETVQGGQAAGKQG